MGAFHDPSEVALYPLAGSGGPICLLVASQSLEKGGSRICDSVLPRLDEELRFVLDELGRQEFPDVPHGDPLRAIVQ